MVRLGAFVIHGNARHELEPCLRSLAGVCDRLIAIDSQSSDGSAALSRTYGAEVVVQPWRGYGAARARAIETFGTDVDYVFFLDSDEWLDESSVRVLREWKHTAAGAPAYSMTRRDWCEARGQRFVYRTETKRRLIRIDCARFAPSMIVHEALKFDTATPLEATIEHAFARSLGDMRLKVERYALLWALRALVERTPLKSTWGRRARYTFRDAVLKGAAFRGGSQGLQLSQILAHYQTRKYEYLSDLLHGDFAGLATLALSGELETLFAKLGPAFSL